jgi:hypothetical protein
VGEPLKLATSNYFWQKASSFTELLWKKNFLVGPPKSFKKIPNGPMSVWAQNGWLPVMGSLGDPKLTPNSKNSCQTWGHFTK